jgi:hypothetical protein
MKKLEAGVPGDFIESAKKFTELRNEKPTKKSVIEIIKKAKARKGKSQPKKSARPRDLET